MTNSVRELAEVAGLFLLVTGVAIAWTFVTPQREPLAESVPASDYLSTRHLPEGLHSIRRKATPAAPARGHSLLAGVAGLFSVAAGLSLLASAFFW